jgi:transcriptional regulator with XRE-family HTH domain
MLKGQWQAARALIGWSQADLAERVGVTSMTIKRLENHPESVSEDAQAKARAVLEAAGVEFIGGARPGVRLGKRPP